MPTHRKISNFIHVFHHCFLAIVPTFCIYTTTLFFLATSFLPLIAWSNDSLPTVLNNQNEDASEINFEPSFKKKEINPASVQPKKYSNSSTSQYKTSKTQETSTVLVLSKAVMCESIKGFEPLNVAVVFSISLGKIYCFTGFENISQNAFVYHKWYHRDRFVATNRFLVKSPQWSTFSTMQLREADKGPWRVEITDEKDILLDTLRFSVVD